MIAFPFDSHISSYDDNGYPIYDRASTSEEFAKLFECLLRDGVFDSNMCQVLAGSGLTATVGTGGMMIQGRFGYITEAETVTFEAASNQKRIDTVVLRRDLSSSVNNIVCAVVKGTPGSNPSAPTLTRDGTIWELGIANVTIPANSSVISQSNINDTRLNNSRCGLVAAIMTDINTTTLYNQIQSDLAQFKAVQEADFEEWFETLQTQLDGDVAASLQSQLTLLDQNKLEGTAKTATLSSSGWSSGTQTVTVSGVTATSTVIVSPAAANFEAYCKAMVRCTAQATNSLTFTAKTTPTAALTVNVLIIEGVQ